ncbi:MAG: hypothetical protein NZ879_05730 [Archaeoglobaceae archaeon]|nr:hypothetical protein [Archaeoglobaceae archaeon]MDW8118467.1 hypothetical protein [Archaeoglobaceae archaeon]
MSNSEGFGLTIVFLGSLLTLASVFFTIPPFIDLVDDHFFGKDKVVIRAYVGEHGGFDPKVLRLSIGCHKIVFIPMDIAQGLAIDDLQIDTGVVLPGEKKELEICLNRSGVYVFRNSISSGPMTPFQIGYLVVEENDS